MPPPDDLAQKLKHLEHRLLDPAVRGDRTALETLLTEDFIEVGSSGRVFDRAAIIAALQAEALRAPMLLDDFRIVASAEHLAVVSYRTSAAATAGVRRSLRSSVWVFRNGSWQMRFHQGTPEPGSARTV